MMEEMTERRIRILVIELVSSYIMRKEIERLYVTAVEVQMYLVNDESYEL